MFTFKQFRLKEDGVAGKRVDFQCFIADAVAQAENRGEIIIEYSIEDENVNMFCFQNIHCCHIESTI